MGIGTRVQYTEVPISAGHVLSDGSIPHINLRLVLSTDQEPQNPDTMRTASLGSELRVSLASSC